MFCGLTLIAAHDVGGQEIAVKPLGDDRYELTLTSRAVIEVEAAQVLLVPTAVELCKNLTPAFGRYRFSSTEPVADGTDEDRSESFILVQQLACSVANRAAPDRTISATSTSAAEAEAVTSTVRDLSITYFDDIANGRYKQAYAVVDEILREFSTVESWEADKRSFRSAAGAPVSLEIVRVTIYDNPPGAPEPGLYVAADFSNEYASAPIHCGYLMWLRRNGGEFRIAREESGLVTNEQLRTIPAEQVPNIRQRLQCVRP